MSLTFKIFFAIILPIVFLLSLFVYFNYIFAEKFFLSSFEKESIAKIEIINKNLQNRINESINIIEKTLNNQKVRKKTLKFILKNQVPYVKSIYLLKIKKKKKIKIYGDKLNFDPFNYKQFKITFEHQKRTVYCDIKQNNLSLNFFIPFKIKEKKVTEILVILFSKSFFKKTFNTYFNNDNLIVFANLIGNKHFIVLKNPKIPFNYKKIFNLINNSDNKSGYFDISVKEKNHYFLAYKKYSYGNLRIIFINLKKQKDLFNLINIFIKRNLFLIIISLLFVLFYTPLQLKIIFNKLKRLTNDVNEFAEKFSNELIKQNKRKSKDEIVNLNEAFLKLKKQINDYSNEIKDINESLNSYAKKTKGKNIYLEKEVNAKVKEIQYHVYHDNLTGLPNRRLFNDRLEMAIAYAQRHSRKLAVLFLDLDNFKVINDTVGHHIGDLFLKKVAELLKGELRDEDTVSRFGGDEFVIIIPDIENIDSVKEVAMRILKILSQPFIIEGKELHTGCSIGITIYPKDGLDVNTLLKNADTAMYFAKKNGKNRCSVFSKEMNTSVVKKIALETRLRKAIEKNEFRLLYQPKVDLVSGEINGMEALVRWQKDEKTLILPGQFIFIAEESDIICQIGRWVLKKACEDTVILHKHGFKVSVAVNISSRQFQDDTFINLVKDVLKETNLPSEYLNIEITENIVMNDTNKAIDIMKKLNDLNVKISIDDFGTGYSSLNYLKQFPVHYLKIDRSFIKDIPINMEDVAITKSIMHLAHTLYLKVVAEGVENWNQLKFLKENGCDEIQGQFCSMPITASELLKLLKKGPILV